MIHINTFKNHINESLGIPESTLFYIDVIKTNILPEVIDYIDSSPKLNDKMETEITIAYTNIKRFVTDWIVYQDFPVSEIIVDLKIVKVEPGKVLSNDIDTDEESRVPIKIGGSAMSFARGNERMASRIKNPIKLNVDHSLSIFIEIDIEYSSIFRKDKHSRKLEIKLESVIAHELNHVYEYYRRKLKGEKEIELTTTWASIGENRMRRPKVLWDFWQRSFADYIYQSEPHEIRAFIQESKSYVDRLDFDTFQKTRQWKVAKKMQTFDVNKFVENFNKIIFKYNPEYTDKIIEMLVKDFVREYKRLSIEFKENPLIKPEKLERMSYEEFLKFWEKRIRESGTILVKKLSRLYSYKRDKEEILL